ncbi:unnamed protein product [Coregonus sp. 'balchen']|nr:unnamed protein product [Coregonus sp. 'balchen']
MYAFYSLLVYIFYTVFKKEEEEALEAAQYGASAEPGRVSMETRSRRKKDHTPRMERKKRGRGSRLSDSSSSSDSDGLSLSDEGHDGGGGVELMSESPLVAVMSHLLSFLEQYSHLQQLQQQADQYRVQLKRHRAQHRHQMKALRTSYRQRLRDKNSVIDSLEEAITTQQYTPSTPGSDGERGGGGGSVRWGEKMKGLLVQDYRLSLFPPQIDELKSCIEEREEELSRLRTDSGATDSEKRVVCLSAENESLKQSLTVTQGLLQQLSVIPSQSSSVLIKENENLRSRVQQLESSLQQRADQLSCLERQSEQSEWRRGEEQRRREERVRALQLELDKERAKEPQVKIVTQTVEVESPATLRQLAEATERNEQLSEKLTNQNEKCRQLEEHIRKSDEFSCNLQHKIAAYEREISVLQEELLKEIGHLEEKKEEAVKAAATCSVEHFQSLQDQFFNLQKRLTALPPTLRTMKTDYASLRSQVRNFSDFYGAAITDAKKQISAAMSEMSEANKDLLEKYRKEVALRRKYHEQLVELKGNIRVLCRVKPVLKEDQHEEGQSVVVTTDPNNESALSVLKGQGRSHNFELDRVFHPQATQEEVFQEIEPLVTSCIDGYHVCIFAYGQTGSGKTYTMEGSTENPGINQRALKHLFSEIEDRKDMWTYTVSVSSVEIYNEVLRDLLSKDGEKLDIKINPDGTGQLHVPGLRVIELLAQARRNRITFGTQMNQHSSRKGEERRRGVEDQRGKRERAEVGPERKEQRGETREERPERREERPERREERREEKPERREESGERREQRGERREERTERREERGKRREQRGE